MSRHTLQRIRHLELFAGCGRSRIRAIDRLGLTLDLAAGRTICHEGNRGREFFVLISGTAGVQTRRGVVSILYSGAWFGEAALLTGNERSATVRTLTPAAVLVLNQREFDTMLRIAPFLRPRLERSAALVATISRPTFAPWYQVVRPGPIADIAASC